MPGEILMCVWEAAWAKDGARGNVKTAVIQKILELCRDQNAVTFSERSFHNAFPGLKITYEELKEYVGKNVQISNTTPLGFLQQLERVCCDISLTNYTRKSLTDGAVKKLWQVFVRLSHAGSYPPVATKAELIWALDGTLDRNPLLNGNWTSADIIKHDYTFQQLLHIVEKYISLDFIDCMHSWLAKEVLKQDHLCIRIKKQEGWQFWAYRTVVMSYGLVEIYEGQSTNKLLETFHIGNRSSSSQHSRFMCSVSRKLDNRVQFQLMDKFNQTVQIQIAISGDTEKQEWLEVFTENIRITKSGITPMIQALKQHQSVVSPQAIRLIEKPRKNNNEPVLSQEELTEKIKTVFLGIDKDGNGMLDKEEFKTLIAVLDVAIGDREMDLIFSILDQDKGGLVTFEEFYRYLMVVIGMNDTTTTSGDTYDMHIMQEFNKADAQSRGVVDFKNFTEYIVSTKRYDLVASALQMFDECDEDGNGVLEFEQFRDIFLALGLHLNVLISEEEKQAQEKLKQGFRDICRSADPSKITEYLDKRWQKFADMKRYNENNELVMEGKEEVLRDLLPGNYTLKEMAFFDEPKVLAPHIVAVKGVHWRSKTEGEKSGELSFKSGFEGVIPTITATNENLSYYGCCFAGETIREYCLQIRHGVNDFDYSSKYLEDYVLGGMGGSGIERHEFDHLDCPLEEDSGVMVIGKYVSEGELHLTGFVVPVRKTVFIPRGTIHSNDYLRGTWRTMLSDEADIDHVQFVKGEGPKKVKFHFTFRPV